VILFTKPRHTLSSVIRELHEGLSDGSIALQAQNEHDTTDNSRPTPYGDFVRTNRIIVTPSEPVRRESPGARLRALREQIGLTMRDVEMASVRVAAKHKSDEYAIPPSRLSDIETKGVVPSIYRLYALAAIYHRDIREIMAFFGVELNELPEDLSPGAQPTEEATNSLAAARKRLLARLREVDMRQTANMGQIEEKWGIVPLSALEESDSSRFTYGYIGAEDLTMYPILLPGSLVQIDVSRNTVVTGAWRNEYQRPIYFVETREGYTCCWCALKGDQLVLQPHPLSPVEIRILKWPQEAEIIGQVVALAIDLRRADPSSWPARVASELIQ
jgi:transcriptional regulator with XRE-family HTH domain